MARGRFREALDVLNEAVRVDPRWAESYDNRANVFERLGMYPQAEADRRKVGELGGVQRPPPPEPAPELPGKRPAPRSVPRQSAPEPPQSAEAAPSVPRYPARQPPRGGGAAAARTFATVLIGFGLLAAAGVGVYIAVQTISGVFDDDEQVQNPGGGTATPAASGDATVTPTPLAVDDDTLEGDPLSYTRFETAWEGKGISATTGELAEGIRGFGTSAVAVTLTRAGATMETAMLFYDGPGGIAADWNLGTPVSPKAGRTIPADAAVWYNVNVVVVVLVHNDSIKPDALEGFLSVNP